MVENTRVVSLSLKNDKADWLKQQKENTGLPESHFVEKGLELYINGKSITQLKDSLALSFYFFVSVMLSIFGFIFFDVLHIGVFIVIIFCGVSGIFISGIGLIKSFKIWIGNLEKIEKKEYR